MSRIEWLLLRQKQIYGGDSPNHSGGRLESEHHHAMDVMGTRSNKGNTSSEYGTARLADVPSLRYEKFSEQSGLNVVEFVRIRTTSIVTHRILTNPAAKKYPTMRRDE